MDPAFDIHPEMQVLIEELSAMPSSPTLAEEREAWTAFCVSIACPRPAHIAVEDRLVRGRDGQIPIRLYRPRPEPGLPCTLYLHGGGWVLGNLDTNDSIAWGLAEGTGATVVAVEYRLAPENTYPAAFRDCEDVLAHLAEEGEGLGIDPRRLAVCGDSAGGNLAAALALAARDGGGPRLAAQALVYPVLGTDVDNESYRANADAPMLTRVEMIHYLDAYLGEARADPEPYAMPLVADDLGGLPPALVHTAEYDPLRDEGRLYADRLAAAGNDVDYRCAASMIHGFLRARFAGPTARAEFDALCGFLRGRLG